MRDRIANELGRDDLTTQIAAAITDSINAYQSDRFRFSESRDTTWNTVANQDIYTSAASAAISSHYYIDYLIIYVGDVPSYLTRRAPIEIEMLQQLNIQAGTPEEYCFYNNAIMLYPTPGAVYTMRMGAHLLIAAPASDSEANNKWMTDAERLIRARAKYQLAAHYTLDEDQIAMMSPHPPAQGGQAGQAYLAWGELKGLGNKVTATGRIRSMSF